MRLVLAPSPDEAAARAAEHISQKLREATAARGQAGLALSGGSTAPMLYATLAGEALDWSRVHVFQVDERVVAHGHPDRNLTALEQALVDAGPLPRANLHAMPVDEPALDAAANQYERLIESLGGRPPLLDVVHLGLGTDGHTASLFPDDPVTAARNASVAVAGIHAGYRRMTFTLPLLNAARCIVWLVTGASKAAVLARLMTSGWDAPAGRVARRHAAVFADAAAIERR